ADNNVYRTEKMLRENADKISAGEKTKIESAVQQVKEALKGTDTSAIKAAHEKLTEAWQAASAELYKAAQERARAGQTQANPGKTAPEEAGSAKGKSKDEGPVIDAEVVDEDKR